MDTKFFKAANQLIEADQRVTRVVAKSLSEFVRSVGAKQKEVQQHNEKAKDAIKKGTKLTKHRIPL